MPKCPRADGKVVAPKVHLKRTGEPVRSPKTISAYAEFTEQGSSASQMTAAKVMDVIFRLPGCDGQAADAVSALNPSENGRCSKIIENSKIGMSRHLDSSSTTQRAHIMVQYGRSSRSS